MGWCYCVKLSIHSLTMCSRTCSVILFFHKNDELIALAVTWKLLGTKENLPANMEENKNLDKHGIYWTANILCVHRKNRQEMVHNELFANFVLITWTSCLWTSSWTCSQVCTQLYALMLHCYSYSLQIHTCLWQYYITCLYQPQHCAIPWKL